MNLIPFISALDIAGSAFVGYLHVSSNAEFKGKSQDKLNNRAAIGREIAKALLSGKDVEIPGLGRLEGIEIAAQKNVQDTRVVWTAPSVEFHISTPDNQSEGSK